MGLAQLSTYITSSLPTIATNYPTRIALGSAGFLAVATTEMAVRVFLDLRDCFSAQNSIQKELAGKNLSENLSGAMLFGMCASNAIPGIAAIGALIFIGNAIIKENKDALWTSQAICLFKPIVKTCVESLWKVASTVMRVVGDILKVIMETASNLLGPILSGIGNVIKVILPKTPQGVAAVVLAAAILVYKIM